MKQVTRLTIIPENSVIANGFDKIDYCDTYRIVKATNDTAEEVAVKICKMPKWVNWLMSIRDTVNDMKIKQIQYKINNRPRKKLNFYSPKEIFS